jgi:hypothetical protein
VISTKWMIVVVQLCEIHLRTSRKERTVNIPATADSHRTRRLVRRLSAYGLAGTALGATDAAAAIIYTNLGPTGVHVTSTFSIDLDANGQDDFRLDRIEPDPGVCSTTSSGSYYCTGGDDDRGLGVFAPQGNRVHAIPRNSPLNFPRYEAIHFAPEAMIQTSGGLRSFGFLALDYRMSTSSNGPCDGGCSGSIGQFLDSPRGYLGLVLDLPDGPHAGWADIQFDLVDYGSFTLFGFAYQTTPGASIAAGAVPEPPSLVLLAAGAAGLAALRRKRLAQRGD